MAFEKFEGNRFRIDGEIAENHAILVNLTASIVKTVLLARQRFYWSRATGPLLVSNADRSSAYCHVIYRYIQRLK